MVRTLLLLLCIASSARAADPVRRSVHAPQAYYRASVAEVHDADTIKIQIQLGFGVLLDWRQVRASGYDAWEVDKSRIQVKPFSGFTAAQWSEEITKGILAREELKALLASGELWVSEGEKRDPHGRGSARFYVRTPSEWIVVSEWMAEHGHCRK